MVEPERDDKTEQKARAEENKQETEQLLKPQRHEIRPSLLLGVLNVYLLFIAAIAAFGVLAFYSGHLITLKIVFFACVPLLLIVPIGTVWYLRTLFSKKPPEKEMPYRQSLFGRFVRSPVGMFVARFGNNRIFRLFNFALCIFMIFDAIRAFPPYPRSSLAIVACYTAFFSILVTFTITEKIFDAVGKHVDIIVKMWDIVSYTYDVAESSRNFIQETEPIHNEAHQSIAVAIRAIHNTTHVIADAMHAPSTQVEAVSPEVGTSEDEEELNNG